MGLAIYDALDDAVSMLGDNWSISARPIIKKSYDYKAVGFVDARRDVILVYPKNENIEYFGLFGVDHMSEIDITIEVRTFMNHDHHNNIVKEISKIVKDNIRRENFVDLMIINSVSGNDSYRNMFKHSLGLRYRKMNPT